MALGTGFIMGLVAGRGVSVLFLHSSDDIHMQIGTAFVISFSFGFFLIYQFVIASFFWGKRRGEFEYSYLEKSTTKGEADPELGKLLKTAQQELRFSDYSSAQSKIRKLAETYPENFIVQFKHAVLCEGFGDTEVAISAYERALALTAETSNALKDYVYRQINRIKTKGPSKWSASPGLKYVLY